MVHGPNGEDGTLQGLLELARVPYVGCGTTASALAMDKEVMKRVCRAHGLPVVDFTVQFRGHLDADAIEKSFGYPVFVKPANMGSSVGVVKAKTVEAVRDALAAAFKYDEWAVVEEAITGREIEVAVLGNRSPKASVPGEIIPGHEFYDYEDKYLEDGAQLLIPAPLPADKVAEVQRLAIAAFRAIDCAGMARVDLFLGREGTFVVNEVNTIPGFTPISMYPKLWEASGLAYRDLLTRLLDLGVAAYLVASTVDAVLAQRLVRTTCPSCRREVAPDPALARRVDLADIGVTRLWAGAGCDACRGTGYRGRTGIYELLVMDAELRREVQQRRGSEELRTLALQKGMRSLFEDGLRLVRSGVTTIDEVLRVARGVANPLACLLGFRAGYLHRAREHLQIVADVLGVGFR